MTFEQWMRCVEGYLDYQCGLQSCDLPEQPWRSWYFDGMGPHKAAAMAVGLSVAVGV